MIEINQLSGFNKEKILILLKENMGNNFSIYVPKSTQQFYSDNEAIALDYLQAAYVGQRLKEFSKKFTYESIIPTELESFQFEIETSDINGLAELLLELSNGYGYGNDDDDRLTFHESVNEYSDTLNSTEHACPEFIEYYYEFIEHEEEE